MALTDIEIAQQAEVWPISKVAEGLGLTDDELIPYGHHMAKVDVTKLRDKERRAKLILVTAINPTPAGEGKTTTTVGLGRRACQRLARRPCSRCASRPSARSSASRAAPPAAAMPRSCPMEDINLHFTGDFHAIGAANNLLAAMLDNHIQQGNALGIDPRRITWKRCVDMNDRQLRIIVDGLGGKANGIPARGRLRHHRRLRDHGRALPGHRHHGPEGPPGPHRRRLHLRRQARHRRATSTPRAPWPPCSRTPSSPTSSRRSSTRPPFVHGGPFANIAHGCNSVMATKHGA